MSTISLKLLLLLATITAGAQSKSPIGRMAGSGPLKANGIEVKGQGVPSWPVFAGDKIVTEKDSLAVISSSASIKLEIRGDTTATLGDRHVVLQKGVVAAGGFSVATGEYVARPKDATSADHWFVVADRDGRRLVVAYRGDVVIERTSGAAPLLIPAGSYATAATKQKVPAADSTDDERANGASPRQPDDRRQTDDDDDDGGAWTIGSLNHEQSVAVVVGVGAAATAATVAGVAGSKPSSRSASSTQ